MIGTSEKRSQEAEDFDHKIKILIVDIEGTTTSIGFVKDTLFPYIRENLQVYLRNHWKEPEFIEDLILLRKQAECDKENGVEGLVPIPAANEGEEVCKAVLNNILWQMDLDRKTKALKQLQGHVMREGYLNGKLKGHVYDDVQPALKSWTHSGRQVYIYSSGSVAAQKLLFGFSEKGDLLEFFSGHFDTEVGPKVESSSYSNIAKQLNCKSEEIMFLTDVAKEAMAARGAGIHAVLVSRPGNAPLSDDDRLKFRVIKSFDDIVFETSAKRTKLSLDEQSLNNTVVSTSTEKSHTDMQMDVDIDDESCSKVSEPISETNEDKTTEMSEVLLVQNKSDLEQQNDKIAESGKKDTGLENAGINVDSTSKTENGPCEITEHAPENVKDKKNVENTEVENREKVERVAGKGTGETKTVDIVKDKKTGESVSKSSNETACPELPGNSETAGKGEIKTVKAEDLKTVEINNEEKTSDTTKETKPPPNELTSQNIEEKSSDAMEEVRPSNVVKDENLFLVQEKTKASEVMEEAKASDDQKEAEALEVKKETGTADVKKETGAADVKKGTGAAEVKKETGAAEVKKETGAAEVKKETGAAEVKKETGAAEVKKETGAAEVKKEAGAAEVKKEAGAAEVKKEAGAAEVKKEAGAAEVKKEAGAAEVKKEAGAAEVKKEAGAAEVKKEAGAAEVKKEAEAAEVKKEAEAAEVKKEAEAAEVKKEAEAAEVKKEAEAAEVKKEAEAAEVKKEAEAAEVKKGTEAVEVKKETEAAEVEKGTETAEVEKGTETAEVEKGTETAEVKKGTETAEVKKGTETAEVKKGTETAEVKKGTETAEVKKGTETAEIKKGTEAAEVKKGTDAADSVKKEAETSEIKKDAEASEVKKEVEVSKGKKGGTSSEVKTSVTETKTSDTEEEGKGSNAVKETKASDVQKDAKASNAKKEGITTEVEEEMNISEVEEEKKTNISEIEKESTASATGKSKPSQSTEEERISESIEVERTDTKEEQKTDKTKISETSDADNLEKSKTDSLKRHLPVAQSKQTGESVEAEEKLAENTCTSMDVVSETPAEKPKEKTDESTKENKKDVTKEILQEKKEDTTEEKMITEAPEENVDSVETKGSQTNGNLKRSELVNKETLNKANGEICEDVVKTVAANDPISSDTQSSKSTHSDKGELVPMDIGECETEGTVNNSPDKAEEAMETDGHDSVSENNTTMEVDDIPKNEVSDTANKDVKNLDVSENEKGKVLDSKANGVNNSYADSTTKNGNEKQAFTDCKTDEDVKMKKPEEPETPKLITPPSAQS